MKQIQFLFITQHIIPQTQPSVISKYKAESKPLALLNVALNINMNNNHN